MIKTDDQLTTDERILNNLRMMRDDLHAIRNWVTFIGIIVLITQILLAIASCNVL
ncbi:MAG: hypothetical protein AAGU15_08830 [Anaerolineaceae bacterium]